MFYLFDLEDSIFLLENSLRVLRFRKQGNISGAKPERVLHSFLA